MIENSPFRAGIFRWNAVHDCDCPPCWYWAVSPISGQPFIAEQLFETWEEAVRYAISGVRLACERHEKLMRELSQ